MMIITLAIASWSLALKKAGDPLAAPRVEIPSRSAKDIDPKAKELADEMCSTYKDLTTLRCTVVAEADF